MAVLMTATLAGLGFVAALRKSDTTSLFTGPATFLPTLMLAGAENTFSEVPVVTSFSRQPDVSQCDCGSGDFGFEISEVSSMP